MNWRKQAVDKRGTSQKKAIWERDRETFTETKNKLEFQGSALSDYKHNKHSWIPCLCYFQIQQWPCLNNVIAEKGLNIFGECAASCVHLYPPKEECTSSSWEDSKIHTPGTTAIHRGRQLK